MMHIAMFDAINSIEDVYTPYLGQVKGRTAHLLKRQPPPRRETCWRLFIPRSRRCSTRCSRHNWLACRLDARDKDWRSVRRLPTAVLEWRQNDGWPTTQAAADDSGPDIRAAHVPGLMAAYAAGEQPRDVYVLSERACHSRW